VISRAHPDIDPTRFVKHTAGALRRASLEATAQAPFELADTLDNDPKDRHVAATALATDAGATVTLDVADFESRVLRYAGVEIPTPGALVGRPLDELPDVLEHAPRSDCTTVRRETQRIIHQSRSTISRARFMPFGGRRCWLTRGSARDCAHP
jgi:hypothetical protein